MVVVLCNCPVDVGRSIARALVDERLVACVNLIGPVTSIYHWQGELQQDEELTLLLKTSVERVSALRERIHALHPYTTPEIVVLPVDTASTDAAYLAWVRASTTVGAPASR